MMTGLVEIKLQMLRQDLRVAQDEERHQEAEKIATTIEQIKKYFGEGEGIFDLFHLNQGFVDEQCFSSCPWRLLSSLTVVH